MAQLDPQSLDQLNEEADIAADYLEGLLDIADYEGDIEMGIRNNRPVVQIVADDNTDIKHLIGRNGEVVDALQQLCRLAVQQSTGERSHLIVDVDGYLKRKRQRLRNAALDAVDEVRDTGEPVSLEPMNSFERKIVHDIVREEGLRSRSHGEEPHRYVTVYMKASAVRSAEDLDDLEDADDIEDEAFDEVELEDVIDLSDDSQSDEDFEDVDDLVDDSDEDLDEDTIEELDGEDVEIFDDDIDEDDPDEDDIDEDNIDEDNAEGDTERD